MEKPELTYHAFETLTNPNLFEYITSFSKGLPYAILEFARNHPLDSQYSNTFERTNVPIRAIQEGNQYIIHLLYKLQQYKRYQFDTRLTFGHCLRFAVMCKPFPIEKWQEYLLNLQKNPNFNLYPSTSPRHLGLMRWLITTNLPSVDIVTSELSLSSNQILRVKLETQCRLELVKYIVQNYERETKFAYCMIDYAASREQFEILKFLHFETNMEGSRWALDRAAGLGNLEIVKFLHTNRTEGCTPRAMDEAAECGHLHVVKFLHENRTEGCTQRAMNQAAYRGHIHIVEFLHHHRTEGCSPWAMNGAAKGGHLNVVKFLHKHRTEGCTSSGMDEAAKNGHLHVVEFLHYYRTEGCTSWALEDAAGSGHLDIVKFLCTHRNEGNIEKALIKARNMMQDHVVDYLLSLQH